MPPPFVFPRHRVRVAFCYKNFGAIKGLSHIGLGVSAMQNVRALQAQGVLADIWPIGSAQDIATQLEKDAELLKFERHTPVSHVVISAPWIETAALQKLVSEYRQIQFVVVSHSNIGFLQADPKAIRLLREGSELERAFCNFHIAGNSRKLIDWWIATYRTEILHLPNMYPLRSQIRHKTWIPGSVLRIGCFCALRPYKNVLTAGAAALEIAVRLRAHTMEFWVSAGRNEGGSQTIMDSLEQMYAHMHTASIKRNNWESWPKFLHTVSAMDLLLQPSYTEGFNMVTADGIDMGVPSVVSDAIDWVPRRWHAISDSAPDMADVGIALLHDPNSVYDGVEALTLHNERGLRHWMRFLEIR